MCRFKWFVTIGFLLLLFAELTAQNDNLRQLDLSISSSDYDEIAPCVTSDGKTLYFTRLRYPKFDKTLIENGENLYENYSTSAYFEYLAGIYRLLGEQQTMDPVNSAFNQDIWIAHSVEGLFDLLEHPDYPLNNALPNSVAALTPEDEPIVINQFVPRGGMQKGFSKIQKADDGSWGFPTPIGIDRYHNSGADVNLSISGDGKVMILSMEREDSYGQSDLFISRLKSDGNWTYPENLGRGVNTPFRESTPHLSKDMKTIYFSSDRSYPGRGCDIYIQERIGEDWNIWSSPRKFRAPINSDADDSHPFFNEATGHLYFSSDRNGSFDIYSMQIKTPEVPQLPSANKLLASQQPSAASLSVGSKIEFSNIYFQQSKAIILQNSYPELRKLAMLLKSNPQLFIRVSGHTDNVGETNLLVQLSEDRANAIKDFLIQKENVDAHRIETIGQGCSQPLNDNSTDELRKQNRRVEIEVIKNNKIVNSEYGTQ